MLRRIAVLAVIFTSIGVGAQSASAAAPANDTIGGATPATIGFSETLDTTDATTDADDTELNTLCGAPATDASVWYRYEGDDAGVVVDVSQSSYTAGVLVGVDTGSGLELVTCGPGAVAFFASFGDTYYVLAIDDQFDGGGNGGLLNISFNEIPPPPTVELTVNPYGRVNARTGVATISGTYTCSGGDFIDVFGDVRQNVGRFTISGSFGFFDFGTCDGQPQLWTAEVFPFNGKFAGGKTLTVAWGFSCGVFDCGASYAEQTVQLRGGRK